MKAIRKDFFMEIKTSYSRFISIFLIVALGVAFYSGVRSSKPDMEYSADKLYDETKFMDVSLRSREGISDEDIDRLLKIEGVRMAEGLYYLYLMGEAKSEQNVTGEVKDGQSIEGKAKGEQNVIKVMSYTEKVNIPMITSGRKPQNPGECVIERNALEHIKLEVGDTISFDKDTAGGLKNTEYTIVGTFISPMYLSYDLGVADIGDGKVDAVIIVQKEDFLIPKYQEACILAEGALEAVSYTGEYNEKADAVKAGIEKVFDAGTYTVAGRNSIQTYAEYEQDAERIGNIGKIVPFIFFLVAALVSLTTMTRMVEEQRTQIGVMKALGYGKFAISGKYLWYSLSATLAGSLIGGILGSYILPFIILDAYKILYDNLYYIEIRIVPQYFAVAVVIAVACVVSATMMSCFRELLSQSAQLMRPAAPKKGKRVFLEKITFIWKHLNFSRKSTVRNLFRYKKRLFMTLFGIGGCMSLLLVGFGLKDSINSVVAIQYDRLHLYDMVVRTNPNADDKAYDDLREYLQSEENIEKYAYADYLSLEAVSGENTVQSYLYVMESYDSLKDFIVLRDRKSGREKRLGDDGIIITEKLAKLLEIKKGESITLKVGESKEVEAVVDDVAENYIYHNIFMTEAFYKKNIGDINYNEIMIKLKEPGEKNEEKLGEKLLAFNAISGTTYIDSFRNKFDEMLGSLDVVTLVLVVSAGGLAFVVLYNLNNININERRRELATLKVLGFYDMEVSNYILRENIIITAMGVFLGIFGGIILHRFVIVTSEVDMVMFGREINIMSFLVSVIITLIFSGIINISMYFKLKKIDMASSLKSVE